MGARALLLAIAILLASRGSARAQPAQKDDPLACSEPIDGDPKTREERGLEHDQRGRELYGLGEFALAIEEWRATWCLTRNPGALRALAQCYERLVDYERTIASLEAYIRHLDPSTEERRVEIRNTANRIKVLRRLPARLKFSTDPPGAAVILDRDGEITRAQADKRPISVPAGHYAITVELPGYHPFTDTVDALIGQPYTYSIRLTPKTGKLSVTAHPADARIYVDGKIAGIGTFSDRYPIGAHQVTVEAGDRPTEERSILLEPDVTTTLYVKMQPPRPRNGRFELLIAATLTGILDGLFVGLALDEQPEVIAALGLGGGALGFTAPLVFLPSYIPAGRTSLLIGATIAGAFEGISVGQLVFGIEEDDEAEVILFGVGTSLAFTAAAFGITISTDVSEGDAALVNSGMLWGGLASQLLWLSFGAEEGGLGPSFGLVGTNLGLLVGGLLATRYELSRGHVALIDLSGVAGLVAGLAVSSFVAGDERSVARMGLGGLGIGLVAGALLTRFMDDEAELSPTVTVAQDAGGSSVGVYGITLRY